METINKIESNEKMVTTVNVRKFAESAREGKIDEVMTTSDFGFMADLIDRGVAQGYTENIIPTTYNILGYRRDTTSFEAAKDYRLNKVRQVPVVKEKGQYLPIEPSEEHFDFKTDKYGCQYDISWEAWLRDGRDLRLLQDLFGATVSWGQSCEYTKEAVFTAAWDANTNFFTVGNLNIWDEELSIANLSTAIGTIKSQTDPAGNVAAFGGNLYLVVPPALEATAKQIINSTLVIGGLNDMYGNANPLAGAATVVTNSFIASPTSWYLFCDPRVRPAVRYGYVSGFEQPQIFVRDSDAEALIGGAEDPFSGSFESDDIELKMRFSFGADLMDFRGAFWSDTDNELDEG